MIRSQQTGLRSCRWQHKATVYTVVDIIGVGNVPARSDGTCKKHQAARHSLVYAFQMLPNHRFLFHLRDINHSLNAGLSLALVAERTQLSRFQFHRLFHRQAGETLKRYTLRLRLERAAARLIASEETVLAVALANGFASHEVFTRAFRRHFGSLPTDYRAHARTQGRRKLSA